MLRILNVEGNKSGNNSSREKNDTIHLGLTVCWTCTFGLQTLFAGLWHLIPVSLYSDFFVSEIIMFQVHKQREEYLITEQK